VETSDTAVSEPYTALHSLVTWAQPLLSQGLALPHELRVISLKEHQSHIWDITLFEHQASPCFLLWMDPLSITLSVVALLKLTEQIVNYAKLTKDARKERAKILREASSLRGLLATLKDIIAEAEHDPQDQWLRATANLATPGGPLNQCELAFQALLKLTPGHGIREAFQRITWNFSKEEVDGLLSQIERVKTLVGIALEMDHTFVPRPCLGK
jgi:hypothetical protein